MQSTEKGVFADHYNLIDRFTAEDGFKLAFSIQNFYEEIPPEIGSISTSVWEWGNLDYETFWDDIKSIETHKCSDYELGLSVEGQGAQLYEPISNQGSVYCIKDKDQTIYGDYDSDLSQLIYIELKKCTG